MRILKVWLAIMVVFIHSNISRENTIRFATGDIKFYVPEWLDVFKYIVGNAISACAVPTFFFMSALLLYRKPFSWKENLRKKTKTLLIPYLILNTFWVAFFFIAQQIPISKPYFANPDNIVANWNFMQWLDAYTGILTTYPRLFPLWFVRDLLILSVLSIAVMKIIDRFPKISFCLLLFLWLTTNIGIKMFAGSIQSICFWGFGCLWARKNISLNVFDKVKKELFMILYIVLIIANVVMRGIIGHILISRLCVLCGSVFWYVCLTKFTNNTLKHFLLWLSGFSYTIYIFHEFHLTIFKKLLTKMLPTTPISQLVQYVCLPFIVICYCILLSIFLKKYFPRTYGVITGNRKI